MKRHSSLVVTLLIVAFTCMLRCPTARAVSYHSFEVSSLDIGRSAGDRYSTQLSGYLRPTQSGSYTFWISSDDKGELLLSTDASARNAERIAWNDKATERNGFDKFPTQKSKGVHLEAGGVYYIQAMVLDLEGRDHIEVAWQGADAKRTVIPREVLSIDEQGKQPGIRAKKLTDFRGNSIAAARELLRLIDGVYSRRDTWVETMHASRAMIQTLYRQAEATESSERDRGRLRRSVLARFAQSAIYDFAVESDWMWQDCGGPPTEWLQQTGEAAVEKKIIAKVIDELGDAAGGVFSRRLKTLAGSGADTRDPRWLKLYTESCRVRRESRIKRLASVYPRTVFVKNHTIFPSFFAYTEGQSDAQRERHFKPGTSLCILEWDGTKFVEKTLIEDENGRLRDPEISYDGKRILFAWKKSDREDDYHLYEMDVASGKTRQLTFGLGFADYEGKYLPNDDIVFSSSRCVQTVDCWWTEVSNLYLCDKDGKYMRRVGFDQVHSISSVVLPNGTVVYTRWDYNDRGQIYPQGLFQMNTDGTGQTEYYGNNSWFPTTMTHARPVPGTSMLIATLHGHHTPQMGHLGLVDISKGRQEASGIQLVAPVRTTRAARADHYGQEAAKYSYPYPLNKDEFVASCVVKGVPKNSPSHLCYVTSAGGREVLVPAEGERSSCQPVALQPRRRPLSRPSMVDYRKTTGTYFLQDVYFGPGLKGVERGKIKKLRVVAIEFRAAGVGSNGNRGRAGGAVVSTPISRPNGSWDVKRVLGEAEVYEDGSACFTVPARTPVYFQAIDDKGCVAQTMRSWSTLMPGERFSCIGCHEEKGQAPPRARATMAMRAGPQKLAPFYGPPRGFSFIKEVQPILDKHCIKCHNGQKKKPSLKLTGEQSVDRGSRRKFSASYMALTERGRDKVKYVAYADVQSAPPMLPPYIAGSAKSKLITVLEKGHNKVELSNEELDKIKCWIDLLIPFCGDYYEANAWGDRGLEFYNKYQAKREKMEAIERANIEAFIEKQTGRPFKFKEPLRSIIPDLARKARR